MAIGFFLWSAATSVTGLVHGFTALLVVRLVLGIGESVAYPSYSKILAKYFPAAQRASANSIIASGLACGPAFGMLLGGVLMSRFGWRSGRSLWSLGSISLVWLLPWFPLDAARDLGLPQVQPGPEPTSRNPQAALGLGNIPGSVLQRSLFPIYLPLPLKYKYPYSRPISLTGMPPPPLPLLLFESFLNPRPASS